MQTPEHGSGRRRTAIVVSGMHRSGTSAVTRVLSLLGAALPDDLIEGRGDNERGFWEGRNVVDLDERVLDRCGAWWCGWERIPPPRQRGLSRQVARARELARDELAGADLVVVKDPRISRLLPLWTLALEQEGFRCVHVLALRHPGAVAGSLERRNGLSSEASTLSWLAHSLDAEHDTRTQPRVVVSFDNLLRDWRAEVGRITRALDLEWPNTPDDVAGAVGEFIEPGLVHESPASSPEGAVAAVAPVYDVLRRWAEDDVRTGDSDLLDAWRAALRPVREQRSAVAQMTRERRELIADLEARDRSPGALGSLQAWNPMRYEGHNLEAAAAWAWVHREREHALRAQAVASAPAVDARGVAGPPTVAPSRRWRSPGRVLKAGARRIRSVAAARESVGRLRSRLAGGATAPVPSPRDEQPGSRVGTPRAVVEERTHLGPLMDAAVANARRAMRPAGLDAGYDLAYEHFDVMHYLLQARHLLPAEGLDPLQHFFEDPEGAKLSPEVNFGTRAYLARHPERRGGAQGAAYLEWLARGKAAGEIADPAPGLEKVAPVLGMEPGELARTLADTRTDLQERMRTGTLGEMFARAAEVEPLIGGVWTETTRPTIPPLVSANVADQIAAAHACQRSAGFARARLVLVCTEPRWGGGRRVEGHITHALSGRLDPHDIVVLYTDRSGTTPAGRFPSGVREVDFAREVEGMDRPAAQRALVELIRSFHADAVVNVNSMLLYQAIPQYGRALASSERLFLMQFCNEQLAMGNWLGLPLRFFYRCFDVVEGVITDSAYLSDWLQERHQLGKEHARRLHVFRGPVDPHLPLVPAPPADASRRPQVFWAGRWDRQKRVDIAFAVARLMPDVDFRMWGEAVLTPGHVGEAPANVTLEGAYAHIGDLNLSDADAWLYTSAWDGVPSQLLEVAMTGIPIVGSLVGGTGEVLAEEDSWPVADAESPEAYARALREVLNDRDGARRRSRALRERMLRERTEEAYADHVASVLFGNERARGEEETR